MLQNVETAPTNDDSSWWQSDDHDITRLKMLPDEWIGS